VCNLVLVVNVAEILIIWPQTTINNHKKTHTGVCRNSLLNCAIKF
jgi:hypothetical protein